MRRWHSVLIIFAALSVGGCSLYPLPQDSSGSTTDQIVANVRCQARRAVRRAFRDAITGFENEIVARVPHNGQVKTYTARGLLNAIDDSTLTYKQLRLGQFVGVAKDPMNYYATTQVAYEFTLDMKENNTQGFSIDLIRQFLRRADQIGIGVTSDRTREISRTFTVQDSFLNLATGISSPYCEGEWNKNIIFPLAGNMPITDLVNTYILINGFDILNKIKPDAADYKTASFQGTDTGPSTPQMADTITFTTKLIGRSEPAVNYNPVGPGFSVARVGFTNNNSREDIHKVIVTITTSEVDFYKKKLGPGSGKSDNPSPDRKREDAVRAIWAQRERNFQDAVIGINSNLLRFNGL